MRPDVALGVRPHGGGGARAAGVELIVISGFRSRRRAGAAVRRPPRPEVGRAARDSPAPLRHRARPRPAGRLRLAGGEREAGSASSSATRGSPGTRLHAATPGSSVGSGCAAATASGARRCRHSCPPRYARRSPRAAQRWNVSAALLAAQLYAESGFNPFARSPARARRASRSSCPARPRRYGLDNPFDADAAIDAQAHLMRDLLRRFGAVPLALAAYNAGAGRGGRLRLRAALPGDARLRRRILGLLGGAGDAGRGAALRCGWWGESDPAPDGDACSRGTHRRTWPPGRTLLAFDHSAVDHGEHERERHEAPRPLSSAGRCPRRSAPCRDTRDSA